MKKRICFVQMEKAVTDSEEFECWAFRTMDGKYHLGYLTMDGSGEAFMSPEVPYEIIRWPRIPVVKVFDYPFVMELEE